MDFCCSIYFESDILVEWCYMCKKKKNEYRIINYKILSTSITINPTVSYYVLFE